MTSRFLLRHHVLALLVLVALGGAACGSGDSSAADPTPTVADTAPEDATSDTDADTDTDSDDSGDEPADDVDESTEPTLGATDAPIPVIAVDDIPALIEEWGTGQGDPLDVARRLIGFPIGVGVPEGSTPYSLSVDLFGDETDADWTWDWRYEAIAPSEAIGEIDTELPDGGPGTVESKALYDPLLTELGWSNVATVISDPSSGAGGPQSVNFAYQYDAETFRLGEIDTFPGSLRVWASEDIDFREGSDRAGYTVEVNLDAQPNFIPIPLLEALFREVPVAPGARLTGVRLRTHDRLADSFDAEEGLRYFELAYTCELLPNSANSAREIYSAGLAGTAYQMGEESFFDPGFIEVVEATIDDNRWTQPVIVLDRYPGRITVTHDPETGEVRSTVEITLEPNREVLEPLG